MNKQVELEKRVDDLTKLTQDVLDTFRERIVRLERITEELWVALPKRIEALEEHFDDAKYYARLETDNARLRRELELLMRGTIEPVQVDKHGKPVARPKVIESDYAGLPDPPKIDEPFRCPNCCAAAHEVAHEVAGKAEILWQCPKCGLMWRIGIPINPQAPTAEPLYAHDQNGMIRIAYLQNTDWNRFSDSTIADVFEIIALAIGD